MRCNQLSLGELGSATSGFETVFLSFLHSGVTSKETGSLEHGLVGFVSLKKSFCNAVTDSACLAGDTAALSSANDVELAFGAGYGEGLVNDELEGFETEVFVDVSLIDGDHTGAGVNTNAGNGFFSSTGTVEVGFCTSIHGSLNLPFLVYGVGNGLLSLLLVFSTCIYLEASDAACADLVVGEHTLNSELHCEFGLGCHEGLVLSFLQTADVTGVTAIVFLFELLAGENSLACVDDDNEFTAVNVGGEFRAMFTSENVSGSYSGLAEGLVSRVDHVPFTFQSLFLCHKSRH